MALCYPEATAIVSVCATAFDKIPLQITKDAQRLPLSPPWERIQVRGQVQINRFNHRHGSPISVRKQPIPSFAMVSSTKGRQARMVEGEWN